MKIVAVVAAGTLAGFSALACGGMTQIDPPTISVDPGTGDVPGPTILFDLQQNLVLC